VGIAQMLSLSPLLLMGIAWFVELGTCARMFDEMLESGVEPNSVTYSVLIRGVLWERDVEGGRELICRLWEMMSVEAEDSVKTAAFANLVGSLCR